MTEITAEILKLVNGGQGLGFFDGKPVFAWNALPGETAAIRLTKEKKEYLEGTAIRINNRSPERIDPEEDHFISCSPWQLMTFAHENHWKREIAKETFKRIGGHDLPDFQIVHDRTLFGYRNKTEYGFCVNEGGGQLSLALHKRGTNEPMPIGKCLLATENINEAALRLLGRLNEEKVGVEEVKSLILRADRGGRVVGSLIVANEDFHFPRGSVCDDILVGFHIYLSRPGSSAPPGRMKSQGDYFIREGLAGKTFKCGPLSFFQVNLDVFEKALSRIGTFVGDADEVVDFYSGVGAIGIALGDKVKSCILVESDEEASGLAGENIEINGLTNCAAHRGSTEKMLGEIRRERTIIFDPPRAGLHPAVAARVLEVGPRKVIYLSCDTATQARDLKILGQKYKIDFCELYNLFPRTPHIESLLVLSLDQRRSLNMRATGRRIGRP